MPERIQQLRATMTLQRWLPSEYPRAEGQRLETFGLACLLLFVFFTPWARDWARPFEVLLVFSTILSLRQILRHDPDAWIYAVLVAFVAWTLWANHLAVRDFPDWSVGSLEGVRDCARLFLFALCGWWLGGTARSIGVIAAAAIAGVLLGAALPAIGFTQFDSSDGSPDSFGFRNSQHAAVIYGTILLALIVLGRRAVAAIRAPGLVRWAVLALALVACLWVLGQTGNRQIWLGLSAGLGVAGMVALWGVRRDGGGIRSRLTHPRLTAVLAVVAVAGAIWAAAPAWDKLEREWRGISAYLSGDTETTEINSATIRLFLWGHAIESIAERPLLGHGGDSRDDLIAASDLPAPVKDRFNHVHNSYLELGTEHGLVATMVFIAILVGLAARVFRAWQRGYLPTDAAAFLLGGLALFAVVNVFESYVNKDIGPFLMAVIGGSAYSLTLPYRRAS